MYDVVIIGGGPGGYAAALYAHNFDLKVALVEKERVGGTCLFRGCIPAKAWLKTAEVYSHVKKAAMFGVNVGEPSLDWEAALDRKNGIVDGLVKALGDCSNLAVEVINGYGRLAGGGVEVTDENGAVRQLETKNVILATGSKPRSIPGYEFDGNRVVSSRKPSTGASVPSGLPSLGRGDR